MILIPAILQTFRSLKDKTLKIECETSELTPEQYAEISRHIQTFGFLAFKKDEFKSEQIQLLADTKVDYDDTTKTPSKRLRDVLFISWKQSGCGYENFEDYYRYHMENFISHIKSKLE